MRSFTRNMLALTMLVSTLQAHAAVPQSFSVLPTQPMAGEAFQLVVPVVACGVKSVFGSVRPNSLDIDVTIEYRADAFCSAVVSPPVPVKLNLFSDTNLPQAGVYRVRISNTISDQSRPARPVGFGLVSVLGRGSPVPVAADVGGWMEVPGAAGADALNSQRVHIEQRGQEIVVQLNTFDAQGKVIWLQGAGTRQGNVFNGPLEKVFGRSPFSSDPLDEGEFNTSFGQLSLEFISPARALLWLSDSQTSTFRTVPLVIVKQNTLGAARKAFNGRWLLSLEEDDNSISAMPAQVLSFSRAEDEAELYVDSAKLYALRCAAAPSAVALAPSCDLIRFGQFVDVKFTQIGWNRLRGTNAAGKNVSLFRVTD